MIANMPLDNLASGLSHSSQLPLTPRERQVLQELAMGKTNKMIAHILSISMYTVDGYVKEIYRSSASETAPWRRCLPSSTGFSI
ncbi:helix-turn-helix transcriptional regulator [Halopseudomonas pachastrellae]|nr:helix-turn-helix transcriptional regulator [Halopseudomonas pachastrellae]